MSLEYPCVHYRGNGLCSDGGDHTDANICVFRHCKNETQSHYALIRSMSDEELARRNTVMAAGGALVPYWRIAPACNKDLERDQLIPLERCEACVLHWLRQPAEEG